MEAENGIQEGFLKEVILMLPAFHPLHSWSLISALGVLL